MFDVFALILAIAGAFFLLVGSIGVVRLPDFYTRTHAVGKSDTLGLVLAILGIAVHGGLSLTDVKLIAVVVFVALTNPVGTHALVRSAHFSGLRPWFKGQPMPEDPTEDHHHDGADGGAVAEPEEDGR
ncbi:MAG: monovalent cation/H(+) antiporter subunit G [Ilumatobacter sp.]|uniref:monovalent cation/H(+) antiporter subunit G n=1 Tax=Ilumatobacter sp. TaxID=1967498 RepID=UPI002635A6AA|nr:monovalent cation/H(+) antiporter subunit G [Ilumatobacter sp.]MDJ0769783.1 monovalent cation/H(+) antiporter subunit G [Ilumatobacter sp.]